MKRLCCPKGIINVSVGPKIDQQVTPIVIVCREKGTTGRTAR
jgi:hypothetical protein